MNIPKHYVPNLLTRKDKKKQKNNINFSRKMYKKKKYISRPILKLFPKKESKHITKAKKIYNVNKVVPSKKLSKKTGCSIQALKNITRKGRGAYYSSGSRPNQSAQSWARARLGSAITGANASVVDYHILEKGCKKNSKALKLAKKKMSGGS